jgi:predicted NBD/HSP70 family sugar kinase
VLAIKERQSARLGASGGSRFGPGAVLDLFRMGGAETRGDVVRLTGMARATVSQRLEILVRAGFLGLDGDGVSTGGRPPSRFAFNRSGGVFLVGDMRASHAHTAVTDRAGTILAQGQLSIDITAGPRPVLDELLRGLGELLAGLGRSAGDVDGVGVAVPGPVEFATGRVISPPIMTGWHRFDIPGYLAGFYPCPVLVDKDANAMAFGEQRSCWPEHPNMLVIEAGTGIGCGVIANGEVYRGALGAAGDIGHIPYGPAEGAAEEPVCRCGNVGCVEAYAGGWALARDLRTMGHDVERIADVVEMIRAQHPDVTALVRRAARVLGLAIADAVNFLNPSVVVIGGPLALADEPLLAGIREVVYRRSLPLSTRNLQIAVSQLGEMAGVVGLALMLGDRVFAPELVDRQLGYGPDAAPAAPDLE